MLKSSFGLKTGHKGINIVTCHAVKYWVTKPYGQAWFRLTCGEVTKHIKRGIVISIDAFD